MDSPEAVLGWVVFAVVVVAFFVGLEWLKDRMERRTREWNRRREYEHHRKMHAESERFHRAVEGIRLRHHQSYAADQEKHVRRMLELQKDADKPEWERG